MAFFKLDEKAPPPKFSVSDSETRASPANGQRFEKQLRRVSTVKVSATPGSGAINAIDFSLAANKHLAWKSRLRHFLHSDQPLTDAELISHRECDLGKWLYSSGMKKYGHFSEMQDIEREHAEFHATIKTFASLQRDGRRDQAQTELAKIDRLSDKVVSLLNGLERKLAIKKPRRTANEAVVKPKMAAASEEWEEF